MIGIDLKCKKDFMASIRHIILLVSFCVNTLEKMIIDLKIFIGESFSM
jgi:hypothetical protein